MHQEPQIPLVVLVFVCPLKVSVQVQDFGSQNSNLHFGRAGVRAHTGSLLWMSWSRFMHHCRGLWGQEFVCVVSSKCFNAFLDDYPGPILRITVRELHDTVDSFLGIAMLLRVPLHRLLLQLRIFGVPVRVLERRCQVFGVLERFLELIGLEEIVEMVGRRGRRCCIFGFNLTCLKGLNFLNERSRLAQHRITKGGFALFLEDFPTRQIGSFALAGLGHQKWIMSPSLPGLYGPGSHRGLAWFQRQRSKRVLHIGRACNDCEQKKACKRHTDKANDIPVKALKGGWKRIRGGILGGQGLPSRRH